MNVRVKICGVTTPECVTAAVEHGADAIGFVFAESPRQVDITLARRLRDIMPAFVNAVAVFRHPSVDWVTEVVSAFQPDVVQTEVTDAIRAAVHTRATLLPVVHDEPDLISRVKTAHAPRETVLLEAAGRGGRGIAPSHDRAREIAQLTPLVLAGGLHPENVGAAIRTVRPYGVDVSSGVERAPGIKDPEKIAAFCAAVREAGNVEITP